MEAPARWTGGVRSWLWRPRRVRAVCAAGRGGRAGLSPARLPGAQRCAAPWQSRPAADFGRLSSSVLQLVPRAQPPACFWEPLAELRALRRGQGDPACSCLRPPLPQALGSPPVAACSRLAVVRCPEFPSRMIPGSAAGPGSPGSSSEVLALLGRDPRSPQVQRHHPNQSLRLPSVCLRVFHGTSLAAVPRECFGGNNLCSGTAPWPRPGARLSKSSECAAQTERRGRPSGLRMK